MQQFHFYADPHSNAVLASGLNKAVLIGSDFGYGNFGDVLQHMGSVVRIKDCSQLSVVSVLSLDAISRHVSAPTLRQSYGVDAQMFVSTEPLSVEQAERLGLMRVVVLRNVACVQLYGGGFLNEMWGGFVLGVTEFFLRKLPDAAYFISGQQISAGYSERVLAHIRDFKPQLVGVRDRDSLENMRALGVEAQFSFDDAVEPLGALSKILIPQRANSGAFLHLNSSGYTGNEIEIEEISSHMRLLSERSGYRDLVLFQAFQDSREEVVDSIETLKRLEGGLPFVGLNTVMLVSFIMNGGEKLAPTMLKGEYGYACSYHITLWLQLNGVPCWLRSSNPYYDQKRRSLGIEGHFEDFLENFPIPDHSQNLLERSAWTANLENRISELPAADNRLDWKKLSEDVVRRSFSFKGEPRLEVRLNESWSVVCGLQEKIALINADLRTSETNYSQASTELHAVEARLLASGKQLTKTEDDLQAVEARLLAYCDQLTSVGTEARQYREQAEREHEQWLRAREDERNVSAMLQEITRSRSWRWTLPVRAINRFARTRRFDAQGNVGIFELVRRVGGKLPLPVPVKTTLGRILRSLRR